MLFLSSSVNVSIVALEQLQNGLNGTISKIDDILSEYLKKISVADHRLNLTLQRMISREEIALFDLKQAEEDLRIAQLEAASEEDATVPQFYYDQVEQCRETWIRYSQLKYEVRQIVNGFTSFSENYIRNQQNLTNDYTQIVKKSSIFLGKYKEYLRQSQQELGTAPE